MILTITDRERELQADNAALLAEVARLTPMQYRQAPCRNQCEAQAFRIDERNLTTALQAMTQSRDELRAERDALLAELEKIKTQEATIFQMRMRPNWNGYSGYWQQWVDCSPEACAGYEKTPVLHDWVYETRKLFLAPGAQPVPDMFWNDDDPEKPYGGIGEFLNDEICNGSLEVGDIRIVQQAKKLPKVHIRITSINDTESDTEWEVISTEAMLEAAKEKP